MDRLTPLVYLQQVIVLEADGGSDALRTPLARLSGSGSGLVWGNVSMGQAPRQIVGERILGSHAFEPKAYEQD
jgi:hypothetical protein